MALFGKREVVFRTVGDKPICSCGAKIDRRAYYVAVRPEDVGRACAVLVTTVGRPLISDELVVPQKKAQECVV